MTSKRSHSRLAMLALAALLGLGGLSLNLTPAHAADGTIDFRFSTQRHACTRVRKTSDDSYARCRHHCFRPAQGLSK